jgi:hypothetical protein
MDSKYAGTPVSVVYALFPARQDSEGKWFAPYGCLFPRDLPEPRGVSLSMQGDSITYGSKELAQDKMRTAMERMGYVIDLTNWKNNVTTVEPPVEWESGRYRMVIQPAQRSDGCVIEVKAGSHAQARLRVVAALTKLFAACPHRYADGSAGLDIIYSHFFYIKDQWGVEVKVPVVGTGDVAPAAKVEQAIKLCDELIEQAEDRGYERGYGQGSKDGRLVAADHYQLQLDQMNADLIHALDPVMQLIWTSPAQYDDVVVKENRSEFALMSVMPDIARTLRLLDPQGYLVLRVKPEGIHGDEGYTPTLVVCGAGDDFSTRIYNPQQYRTILERGDA